MYNFVVGAHSILEEFQNFHKRFPFIDMEQAVSFFAMYGGVDCRIDLDLFESIELSAEINFVQKFELTAEFIEPSYLQDTPYRDILMAIARGDGRLSNIFKRAKVADVLGREIINDLAKLGILSVEPSRQAPLKTHPKQLLPKHLRGYRIESKVRFKKPFYRFWFGFVEPYRHKLSKSISLEFIKNFEEHKERAYSLLFEQLSSLLLEQHFSASDCIISQGSFWDHNSEFDILSVTKSGKIILGECKYTSRPVTKKELTKLKDKAEQSSIKVDIYTLFSKSGFSKELIDMKSSGLLLFELDDFIIPNTN